jgi:hypothetical protein
VQRPAISLLSPALPDQEREKRIPMKRFATIAMSACLFVTLSGSCLANDHKPADHKDKDKKEEKHDKHKDEKKKH